MPCQSTSAGDTFIGIDLGTSGCRAIAIDAQGNPLAECRVTLPDSTRPHPGWSQQWPHDWWQATCDALRGLQRKAIGRPRALAVDGTSSTLLLTDRNGEPLTPGLMYDDTRAAAQARLIAEHAPPDSPARGAGSALAKLLYLNGRGPVPGAVHAMHQADWISARLSGHCGISDENNALKLGYDPLQGGWPAWISATAAPVDLLPQVVPAGRRIATIAPAVADMLALPVDIAVVAGTTDSNAAALAAGIHVPGDAVTSLGTTLVLKVLSEHAVNAARFGVYSHRVGDHWLTGGASNTGGGVLRKYFSDRELLDLTPGLCPDRLLDLGYYPLSTPGERFPHADPDRQPRLAPRPARRVEFLQAILEGIADIECAGYRRLTALGAPPPQRVYTAGGGAVNEAWRCIRERKLGIPVIHARQTEAAYGAALLALRGWRGQGALG